MVITRRRTSLNLVTSWLKFSTRKSWDELPIHHSGSFPSLTKENQNQASGDGSILVICVCRVLKSGSSWARSMSSLGNMSHKKSRTKHLKAEEILSQHHDYSVADIAMFQAKADQFMPEWVTLYGLDAYQTTYTQSLLDIISGLWRSTGICINSANNDLKA
jgi:hypothetical protein